MWVRDSAGLALFAICLIAGQSEVAGVTNCAGLTSGIIDGAEIELENSFECDTGITIEAGISVTITGGGNEITIGDSFTATGSRDALFYNQGTLQLTGLTIIPSVDDGIYVRGVYNEGELTITGSSFDGLNIGDEALASGGAVSVFKESMRLTKPSISFVLFLEDNNETHITNFSKIPPLLYPRRRTCGVGEGFGVQFSCTPDELYKTGHTFIPISLPSWHLCRLGLTR